MEADEDATGSAVAKCFNLGLAQGRHLFCLGAIPFDGFFRAEAKQRLQTLVATPKAALQSLVRSKAHWSFVLATLVGVTTLSRSPGSTSPKS